MAARGQRTFPSKSGHFDHSKPCNSG